MVMTMGMMGMANMANMGMMGMGNGVLVPSLLGSILALKGAILLAPAITVVAFLFGQGATIICAQVWWRVLQYNRQNKLRRLRRQRLRGVHGPPPHAGRHFGPGPFEGRIRNFMQNLIRGGGHRAPPHASLPSWAPPSPVFTEPGPGPIDWPPPYAGGDYPAPPISEHGPPPVDAEPAYSIQNPASAALPRGEYDKLMAWTKGAPLDLNFTAVSTNATVSNVTVGPTVDPVVEAIMGNLTILTTTPAPEKKSNSTTIRLVYSTSKATKTVPIRITHIKRRKDEGIEESIMQKYRKGLDDNFLRYIRKDIRNFFTIITNLDENKCIQKLVCDIHSRVAPAASKRAGRTTRSSRFPSYETHVLNAFKFLDIFFEKPSEERDSTTKYRKAAELGKNLAHSTKSLDETCQSYYKQCGYSADDIMSFGNRLVSSSEVAADSFLSSLLLPTTTEPTTTTRKARSVRAPTEDKSNDRSTTSMIYKAIFSRVLKYLL